MWTKRPNTIPICACETETARNVKSPEYWVCCVSSPIETHTHTHTIVYSFSISVTKTPTMRHGWRHDCFHVLLLFCFQISGTDSIGFHLESQRAESIVTLVLNSATVSYRVLLLWSCWKTHREGEKASPAPPSVIRVHGAMMLSWCFLHKKTKKQTKKQKSTWTYSLIFWGYNSSDLQKKKKSLPEC